MALALQGIQLRQLRYFLTVSEELHFGHAAERLYIAQPALSQAIQGLEEELGVQLLARTSRSVALTAAGRVFTEEASKVLASFDRAVAEARRAGGVGAALRIGCIPYLPPEQLLRVLRELHKRDPNSHTEVIHLSPQEQVRRLRDGELDLGIFYDADGHELLELEFEQLFVGGTLAAFLPPHHHLAGKQVLGPNDLQEEVLVTLPRAVNPRLYDRMQAEVEKAGYRLRVREVGSTSLNDLLVAVADGVGVALLPLSLKDDLEASGIVIGRGLKPPPRMADVVIAWPANAPRQLRVALAVVREVAREIRKGEN